MAAETAQLLFSSPRPLGKLAAALAAVLPVAAASVIGNLATMPNITPWYETLAKPPFNPPNWVFGPVWTALYVLMAWAFYRILRSPEGGARRQAIALFPGSGDAQCRLVGCLLRPAFADRGPRCDSAACDGHRRDGSRLPGCRSHRRRRPRSLSRLGCLRHVAQCIDLVAELTGTVSIRRLQKERVKATKRPPGGGRFASL